jgi:hypothetical protein
LRDAAYLARFAGRYHIPGGSIATVTVRGNTLIWTQGTAQSELDPEDGSRFVLKANRAVSIEFRADAAGKVTGARVAQPGAVTDVTKLP